MVLVSFFRVEAPGKKLCCQRTPLEVILFVMFCISTAVAVALIIVLATRTGPTTGEYLNLYELLSFLELNFSVL